MEYLYRLRDQLFSNGADEYGESTGSHVQVLLDRFCIMKRTPKGAWIDAWGEKKFVNLTARKQYACETLDAAKQSYLARKKRQVRILSSRLSSAESAIRLIESDIYRDCFKH
jgi:hypothetical protein